MRVCREEVELELDFDTDFKNLAREGMLVIKIQINSKVRRHLYYLRKDMDSVWLK